MAHKRSDKKTSFGKKSGPEKAFLKKGRNARKEDAEDKPKRSFGRSSGYSAGRSNRSEDDRFSKRSSSPDGNSEDRPKRPFSKSSGFSKRKEGGDQFSKRPSRSGSDEQPKRPFRSSNSNSGWSKKSESGFSKKDGQRPSDSTRSSFSKDSRFGKRAPSDKPYSKDKGEKGFEDFKPGRSTSSLGFIKKGKSTPIKKESTSNIDEPKSDVGLTRLNKYIANSGMGSRREADEIIKKGLISVNGVTVTEMGFKVKQGDVVRYEDKVLKAEKLVYVLLNKPKGFITTTADPQERKTVMNLVASACKERLYPVGRLDRNTTGLLLLTNDGDLAAKLTHPSYNTKKIYKVELDRPLSKNDFQKIQDGVHLEEGKAIVDDLAYASDDKKTIGIELHIGWNRIVRRIFESLEYEVAKLDRVIFAGLDKKDLPRGEWRFLKSEEIVRLKHFK